MTGTIVNVIAILCGTLVGCLFKKGIPERLKSRLMQALGLCTLLIGAQSAMKASDLMCVIISMITGTLLGSAIGIEMRLTKIGNRAEKALRPSASNADSTFVKGFVTASLVFCVGAMAIVGSLDSGLRGDHTTLLAKSALDGVASLIFASTLGVGVALSAVTVLIYQGGITLLAGIAAPLFSAVAITEMSAVGGLLIIGIGINLLFQKDVKVADMLPAVFVPLIYVAIMQIV